MSSDGRSLTVAVIGAGFGGIATAVKLLQRGVSDVTVFEKSGGVGGTWWDNRYPGAECDVPSHLYSFSFHHADWTRTHAGQAEIQRYVEDIVNRFGLRPRLRLGTAVRRVEWDDAARRHTLHAQDGTTFAADVVVSALGMLNVPSVPALPGLDLFAGPAFHTARWEHGHDLRGRRVAVIGAGSTATQVVPALAGVAGEVLMFQREPAWVLPKDARDFTPEEIAACRAALARRRERARLVWGLDRGNRAAVPGTKAAAQAEAACREHIRCHFPDDPQMRAALTPDYPFRCKRIIVSSDLYPALARDDVRLVPHGVRALTRDAVVDATGAEHPVDAVVLATGFRPWDLLTGLEVVGRGGRTLHGVWGDEPEAFLGMTVAGFPNFFVIYGPNTNGGCVSFTLERQAEWVARVVDRMRRRSLASVEVRRWIMDVYNAVLSRRLAGMAAWEAGCHSYYHGPTGKNVTQWPWGHGAYMAATRVLGMATLRTRPAESRSGP